MKKPEYRYGFKEVSVGIIVEVTFVIVLCAAYYGMVVALMR
ncbi:MAG: hypothetical protein ACRDDX_14620 [Cellulosilyticaceae bacterium]